MADLLPIFLDANILVRPLTRTLLIAGAHAAGFRTMFSATAVAEADRHLSQDATPVATLVARFDWAVSPDGSDPDRFTATDPKDRQILADAVESGALFLVTDDADDFGVTDLEAVGISAVSADLFLAARLSALAYHDGLNVICTGRVKTPKTPVDVHQRLGRTLPRLVTRFADEFNVVAEPPTHPEPAVIFRGPRCLYCQQVRPRPPSAHGRCAAC